MANNKKVITLGLDYSQFDGGITEVNRKMKLLDDQFKLASEQTKQFGDATDQLTLKQDQLTQKISLQTQKVKLSKEAYDKAVEGGKASDKQLDNLNRAYIKNQTSLEKLNSELKDNKEKIDNAKVSAGSFGDSIRGMASAIGADVNPMLESVATKFDGVSKEAGNAALVIATVVTALVSMTMSTAEAADEIDALAQKTGLTTDAIQELNYAADFLEVSTEEIGSSMAKMTRNMDSSRDGTNDAAEAFRKLGVRVTDTQGNLRDSEEVFYNTIDALGRVKNETERDALSMAIFGKSAMSLNGLIEEGSEGLKKYAKQAHDAGYVMDEETIASFVELDDATTRFNKKLEAVQTALGEALLPSLTFFTNLISGIPTPMIVGIVVFGMLAAIILSVAKAASTMAIANTLLAGSNAVVGATGKVATAGMLPLLLILLAIAAAIAIIVGGASAISKSMNEVKTSASGVIDTATSASEAIAGATNQSRKTTNTYRGYASGTNYYPGGEAWVGEDGPERVRFPRGTQIFSNEESKAMSGTVINNYYNTISAKDVKEFNDITRIVQSRQQATRRGIV
jgi:hypothetical protein